MRKFVSQDKYLAMVPPTTEKAIVFPYNLSAGKFETQHYNPNMTEDKLSTEEITELLQGMQEYLKGYHRTVRSIVLRIARLLIPVMVAMAMILTVLMLEIKIEHMISILCVSYAFIGCCILVLLLCLHRSNIRTKKIIQDAMKNIKLSFHQRFLALQEKGLMVVLPKHFPNWVEIRKELCSSVEDHVPANTVNNGNKEDKDRQMMVVTAEL